MVCVSGERVNILGLEEGRCRGVMLCKVDRVFFPEILHFVPGGRRLKEVVSMDMVVFDSSGKRVLVSLEDEGTIGSLGNMFLQSMCYRMSNFIVRKNGKGFHSRFHIVLTRRSIVERAWELLPEHCFNLISVTEFARGVSVEGGVIDVCGTLGTLYETGMEDDNDVYGRHLFMTLEDKTLSNVWGNSVLICRLHGSVVGETLASFAEIGEPEGVFVVVQFAMPTPCAGGGHPMLKSYSGATKVHFDAKFPEVLHRRAEILGESYLASCSCHSPECLDAEV